MGEYFDSFKVSYKNIYNFTVEDGKVSPPSMQLPECVIERVEYFREDFNEGGLTFMGYMKFVLAYEEDECEKEYSFGAAEDWLKVSPEFKAWRDGINRLHEAEIAIAVLFGSYKKE